MKVTVSARGDAKTSQLECKTFDVKCSTTTNGYKIAATAKLNKMMPTVDLSSGSRGISAKRADPEVSAEISKSDVTLYHDNLQLAKDGVFAPRFKMAQKVSDYAVDAELAMKGNTAEDRKNKPSSKDVVTVNVKGPKIAGFTPKATYSNGSKGYVLDLAGKIGKVDASLKAEYLPGGAWNDKSDNVVITGTAWYPLPEGARAKLKIKDDLSGEVELHKGGCWVEIPIKKGFKPPTSEDVSIKYKKAFDFDL